MACSVLQRRALSAVMRLSPSRRLSAGCCAAARSIRGSPQHSSDRPLRHSSDPPHSRSSDGGSSAAKSAASPEQARPSSTQATAGRSSHGARRLQALCTANPHAHTPANVVGRSGRSSLPVMIGLDALMCSESSAASHPELARALWFPTCAAPASSFWWRVVLGQPSHVSCCSLIMRRWSPVPPCLKVK